MATFSIIILFLQILLSRSAACGNMTLLFCRTPSSGAIPGSEPTIFSATLKDY